MKSSACEYTVGLTHHIYKHACKHVHTYIQIYIKSSLVITSNASSISDAWQVISQSSQKIAYFGTIVYSKCTTILKFMDGSVKTW